MANDLTELFEDDVLDTPMDENDNLECYDDCEQYDVAPLATAAAAAFAAVPSRPSVNASLLFFQDDYDEALRVSQKEVARKNSGVSCDASPRSNENVEAPDDKSNEIENVAGNLTKFVLNNEVELKPAARGDDASDSDDDSTIKAAPSVDSTLSRIWDKLEMNVEQAHEFQSEPKYPPQQVKHNDLVHERVREGEYSREDMMLLKEMELVHANCGNIHEESLELLHLTRQLPRAPCQKWERKLDKKNHAARQSTERPERNKNKWNSFQKDQKNQAAFRDPNGAEAWRKSFRNRGQEHQMPKYLKEKPEWQLTEKTSNSSGNRQAFISDQPSPVVDYSMTCHPGFDPPPLLAQHGHKRGGAWSEEASRSRTVVGNRTEVENQREADMRLRQLAYEAAERCNGENNFFSMDRRCEEEKRARNKNRGWNASPELLDRYWNQRGHVQDEHDSRRTEAKKTSSTSREEKPLCRGRGQARFSHEPDEDHFIDRTPARVDHRQERPSGSQYSAGRDAGSCSKFSITISNGVDIRMVHHPRDERDNHQPESDGYEFTHEDLWKLQEMEEMRRLRARTRRNGEPIFPTLVEEYGTEIPEQRPLRMPSQTTTWIERKVQGTTFNRLAHYYDPETDTARVMMPWEVRQLYRERGGVHSRTLFAMLLKDPESTKSQEVLLNENSELQPFYGVIDSCRKESEYGVDKFRMEESLRAVERLIAEYLKTSQMAV